MTTTKLNHLILAVCSLSVISAAGTSRAQRDAEGKGGKPEQIRALASLPTVNISFQMDFKSSDAGIDKSDNTPRRSEAELLAALKTSPADAAAWCDLGTSLISRALHEHLHAEQLDSSDIPKFLQAARDGRLTRDDVQRAKLLLDEALNCFTRAIEADPKKFDAYIQRAANRMFFRTCLQAVTDYFDGTTTVSAATMLAPDVLADFQQVARLRPDHVSAQTSFATYAIMADATAKRAAFDSARGFDAVISEKSQAAIRENCARLETLAAGNATNLAAAASEGLGVINFMLNGTGGDATKHFRRAVTLDSNREHAWEMLVAISLAAERFDELLAVCVERVKVADTIRNRYILAKAHERLKQLDKVAEQLDIILKREPDNFAATAGMATVSLRRGDDAKADDWLARADKLATDLSADRQDSVPAEQRADLRALHAIRALLAGDRDAAELHLGHAFKLDSDNKNARAVMRTMGP